MRVPFSRLEGVYWQGRRAFVVTYQGWWLDLRSEQIRQLSPVGGAEPGEADFGYGPGWQVSAPIQGRLRFELDAAGNPVKVSGIAPGQVPVDAARVRTRAHDVRFPSRGAVVAATVTIPPGPGPHPGIVIVQGSGPLDRHFESISQFIYLSMGFAVLAFDKRGTGSSTGVYPGDLATAQTISIEAADAAAAARFMLAEPQVDNRQVGFDGNSQGGWVAPLAARRVPGIRFAILIAAPAVTANQQGVYADFSGGSQYVPTEPRQVIDAAVRAAPDEGYDPAPALAALRIPALWIYGQLDRQVPVRVCVAKLASYHDRPWTVHVLPGGSHGLIATRHGLDTELAAATRFAPGYFTAVRAWVAAHIAFPR
jgi:dienelactone hydrolase